MATKRGYYSLVQFSPNPSRAESVNLGVILFCPDAGFLEARMSAANRRAAKLVGRGGYDATELNAAKRAIERRLHVDRAAFQTREGFQRFAETRANILKLTEPRPVKVVEPGSKLEQLFQELVGGRTRARRDKAVIPQLDELFHRLEHENRAQLNVTVMVPIEDRPLYVPYAYRNGELNLVRPQLFPNQAATAVRIAGQLALAGDLLQRHHDDQAGARRLIVVPSFKPSTNGQELKGRVVELLGEYKVKSIAEDEVSAFVAQVEQEAH
jgi:hypothetical protein